MRTRYETIALLCLALLICVSSGCAKIGDEFWINMKKGNLQYSQNKFDDAMKSYHDAELSKPQSQALRHNIGNVFYKQKNYEKAAEAYEKVINGGDRQIAGKGHYNLGNVYFRQDKLEEAINEYKQAVEIDPEDVEAKYNLEFARVKLKEKISKQQKEQQEQEKKEDKHEKNKLPDDKEKQENPNCPNPQSAEGGDQQQAGQKKQEEKQGAGQQPQPEAKKDEQEQKQAEGAGEKKDGDDKKESAGGAAEKKDNDDMTKEEAMRILRALDGKEKDDQKARMMPIPASGVRVEKDW